MRTSWSRVSPWGFPTPSKHGPRSDNSKNGPLPSGDDRKRVAGLAIGVLSESRSRHGGHDRTETAEHATSLILPEQVPKRAKLAWMDRLGSP